MEAGLIGLATSGKTTLFNLLTHGRAEVRAFGSNGSSEPNVGMSIVPDARLEFLSKIYFPKKTTSATVKFVDVAGMSPGEAKDEGFSPALLSALRNVDALIAVARAFRSDVVPHPQGSVDAARDAALLDFELIVADLATVERRLERIEQDVKKGRNGDKATSERERALFLRLRDGLQAEKPIRQLGLTAEEEFALRNYSFLSAKPMLLVMNVGESDLDKPLEEVAPGVTAFCASRQIPVIAISAQIEHEISQMDADEAAEFMRDFGLKQSARERLIQLAYETLGLTSFFTVGPDECRAWTVRRGDNALTAAGKVHSDIARGFIRAEVISYDHLALHGSWNAAKEKACLRLEGKEYMMADGDCVSFRFSV